LTTGGNTLRFQTFFIAVLFLILSSGYSQSANFAPADSPENFIRNLYREHLSQYDKVYWFDNEEKLSKYFDSNLTALFLRDEECKEKTQGICNLDFDPIIDAQDFDNKYPVSLEVKRLNSKSQTRCKVIFSNITKRTLIYELRQTKGGWRIVDIIYSNGQSLKKLLSQKPDLK
jgi:hypothetical protein